MTSPLHNATRLRLRHLPSIGSTLVICSLLAACTPGPKYHAPAPPPLAAKSYKESTVNFQDAAGWKVASPQEGMLRGKWWEVFHDPELNGYEEQLDINNQNIKQYFENFMAARAQVNEARAGYYPTLGIAPAYTRSSAGSVAAGSYAGTTGAATTTPVTSSGPGTGVNFFSIPLEASWAPDVWGRVANTVRQYKYAAQVSAADLENERLTEQAALAVYYFELRGQDSLKTVYDRTIAADRQSLEYTRGQAETGVGSQEALVQAEVTLENAEATAVGVATNRAVYEHAIAMLIGKPASSFSLPFKELTAPVPAIPIGVPSELLQRRPDIAAAERTLAEANALIGVEQAAYYPSVTLSATGGVESTSLGTLFSVPALFWSLGASASETIFDGGLRGATMAQYTALYRADVAAYRQTVLTAFEQVEDQVATLRTLSQQIAKQEIAVRSARRYVEIATAGYQTGIDPYLDVITAETTLLGDEQTLLGLKVNEMTAAVQLVQAVGGGWDASRLPDSP
jgi:NodT family efflux transporter outer membrane factor (OMF) lipoprotein